MSLTKVCKSCQISENDAKEMILAHHSLEHLIPKKKIKEIKNIELSSETYLWIKKTAKTLKISTDAVISGILRIELDRFNIKKDK